jgi:hypothetical protein
MTDAPEVPEAVTPREKLSSTGSDSPATVHEKWQRAVAKAHEERQQARREREDTATKQVGAMVARLLGARADDGTGHCKWCRTRLGTDGNGERTHIPDPSCPGPAPEPCELCGRRFDWDAVALVWSHRCGGGQVRTPAARQVERVQTPGAPSGGAFGYRRGGDE